MALGGALAGLGVILGAFGAHWLKQNSPESVSVFQTGVQYQMYHALALILVGILFGQYGGKMMSGAGWSFLIGIILFSGSLYVLAALKAVGKVGLGGIGIITPIGGLFFIIGWICFITALFRK